MEHDQVFLSPLNSSGGYPITRRDIEERCGIGKTLPLEPCDIKDIELRHDLLKRLMLDDLISAFPAVSNQCFREFRDLAE